MKIIEVDNHDPITYPFSKFARFLAIHSDCFEISGSSKSRYDFILQSTLALENDEYKELKPFLIGSEKECCNYASKSLQKPSFAKIITWQNSLRIFLQNAGECLKTLFLRMCF